MEDDTAYCGHLALPKFRKQAGGMMTPCVQEPHHRGNHVYAIRVEQGIDHHSHAIQYFEEVNRSELKPVMNVDMEGNVEESGTMTCAALWQYFELVKHG